MANVVTVTILYLHSHSFTIVMIRFYNAGLIKKTLQIVHETKIKKEKQHFITITFQHLLKKIYIMATISTGGGGVQEI